MGDWADAEQHVDRAHEFFELGRLDDAEAELREALSVNPYQAEWHFNLGLTLDAAGRYREASGAMAEAHRLEPGDAHAAFMAGSCSLRSGDTEDAIVWFERARGVDDQMLEPVVGLIEANTALDRHDEAEVAFYLAQQIAPEHAPSFGALSDSLLARGETARAVWCLREAARLDPELPHVEGRLARAYAQQGRHERAYQLYMRELRRDPGDTETLLELARLLGDTGRTAEADEKLRRLLEIEPEHADGHAALGDLHANAGSIDKAIESYTFSLRIDPSFGEVRRRMVELLTERGGVGDAKAAAELLREEVAQAKGNAHTYSTDALEHLAELLLDRRLGNEAKLLLEMLVSRNPDSPSLRHLLSVACFQSGDLRRGLVEARSAIRLDGSSIAPMHNLAVVYTRRGRWSRALLWCGRALRLEPDDREVRRLRGRIRLRILASTIDSFLIRFRPTRSS